MSAVAMRERFAETTTELLDEDPSVAVVLADISASMFADAQLRLPDRVVNVGIREQLAVNVGAGMALTGMRPIVHTFASFLVERSFEQIKLGFSHQDVGGVRHVPHRLLSLGVPRAPELRRYGSPGGHERAHAPDATGIRRSIAEFLID
jgi:transketolase C-terminal domain/subunit